MRNRFLVLIILSILFSSCKTSHKSKKEVNVLFIGNSLTYFHEMPLTVQSMLNETHPNIKVSQSTFPGMSLDSHLDNIITATYENGISTRKKEEGEQTKTELKILEKPWDIIILQGGTVSFLIPEARKYSIHNAISTIKKMVTNQECRFILFNTWPSKNPYPKKYCYSCESIDKLIMKDECCSENIISLEQELKLINDVYQETSKKFNLENSNNPNKVYEILKNHPEINVYEDDIHPNAEGSFLNACIFYQMITGKKAENLKYAGNISAKMALKIKQIVK